MASTLFSFLIAFLGLPLKYCKVQNTVQKYNIFKYIMLIEQLVAESWLMSLLVKKLFTVLFMLCIHI